MAAIPGITTYPEKHAVKVVWTTAVTADTFVAVQLGSRYTDRIVTVQGTFNSATILVKGSVDGTNYHTLTGPAGSVSFTAAGLSAIIESTPYVQITHSGGGGSESVTVTLYATAGF